MNMMPWALVLEAALIGSLLGHAALFAAVVLGVVILVSAITFPARG